MVVHQNLDRDQLAYCNLARERQQRAYELVREQHALTVAWVLPTAAPSETSCYTLTSPQIFRALQPNLASLWHAASPAPIHTMPPHTAAAYIHCRPCGRRRRAPFTAPAGTLAPRAINHSDLCRTPYTAAAHRCRGYLRCRPSGRFHCRPCGRNRRRRAPCTAPAGILGPRVMYLLGQQHPALAPCTCSGSDSALAPRTSAAFIAPTAPLRQQNSALAPCTSAAFIAPTVPLRQQNSALAPCTCYGSDTRPSRHLSPGPRTATTLGARIMIDGITGKYTRAPTLYGIALMARPLNFSKWLTRSLPQR